MVRLVNDRLPGLLSDLLPDLLDLVLPVECAACGRAGSHWCARCRSTLEQARLKDSERRVKPDPAPAHLPLCCAWGRYSGSLRSVIRAWKDDGRRDLERGLADLLVEAMVASLSATGWPPQRVLVVPVPSSARARRRRGDRPLDRLAAHAVQALESPSLVGPLPLLRHRRGVVDQAGLGAAGRHANLVSSMEVAGAWSGLVRGRCCLVVDDILTTGSTLAEASRSLHAAGARDVIAAVVAITPRLSGTGTRA